MRGKETRQVPAFLEFTIRWWKQTAKTILRVVYTLWNGL